MTALAIAGFTAGALGLAAAAAVVARARRIRARHRRFLTAAPPTAPAATERVLEESRALYHGTAFADGGRLLAPAWAEACVCDLWLTSEELWFRREAEGAAGATSLVIPLAWVEDATLLRAPSTLAGRDLPQIRLRWRRGGEQVQSAFSLRGGLASLERLRREIHVRQGQGSVRDALGSLLTRQPEPGGGAR